MLDSQVVFDWLKSRLGLSKAKLRMQGEKKGREVPGPLRKVQGLLDFFGPGTTGPRDLQGF